ncbi:YqjK family protein [Undibacterium sp. SXout11W]|uniref:YqjK family protein n=1 Tax=Undibacterium sp. SXout11W TaxID=3413050 RepID=UPI003BF2C9C9
MTTNPNQLAQRREALLLKIRAQRQVLTLQTQDIRQSLDIAEFSYQCASSVITKVKQRPLAAIAIAVVVFVIKPTRIASASKTALKTWQIWQTIVPVIKRFKSESKNSS